MKSISTSKNIFSAYITRKRNRPYNRQKNIRELIEIKLSATANHKFGETLKEFGKTSLERSKFSKYSLNITLNDSTAFSSIIG